MKHKEKPTEAHRQELLRKLESIIKILNDKVGDDEPIPTLQETVSLSMPTKDEQASVDSINQKSSFEKATIQKKIATRIEKTVLTKTDNPFLPRHIRSRRYNEDQNPQPLNNSAENSAEKSQRDFDSSKGLHDSIIDNLIAFYLPKIEADLRRQLKALAAKETDNKTQ